MSFQFRFWCALLVVVTLIYAGAGEPARAANLRFEVALPVNVGSGPRTGRLFIMISPQRQPEVRLQNHWVSGTQMFARDVNQWRPDTSVTIDGGVKGFPFAKLDLMPDGDYYVQAYFQTYKLYHRADGHAVWAMDQWYGYDLGNTPGDVFSAQQLIHLHGQGNAAINLALGHAVPPAPPPADTDWVKHVKLKSQILSKFWGSPIYLGAVVLLPKGYKDNPSSRYPVIFDQWGLMNMSMDAPFGFSQVDTPESPQDRAEREASGFETGYQFQKDWASDNFPRAIAVTIQHPTPYAEFSEMLNSDNNGPYDEAVMKELIPEIERRFRGVGLPSGRFLVGKTSGGLDALALQLHHPNAFGGAWIFYPWTFDFRAFFAGNIYTKKNAYLIEPSEVPVSFRGPWWKPEDRMMGRTLDGQPFLTVREFSRYNSVVAERFPGGELGYQHIANGPVGADGYPVTMWDLSTGAIRDDVAQHWKKNADLSYFARQNWGTIGKLLVGKLHFYVGEADEYNRNISVHLLEQFLKIAKPDAKALFVYAGRKGNMWQPMTNASLVRAILYKSGDAKSVDPSRLH